MDGLFLLAGATCALVVLGLIESLRHQRNLSRIPIRVHVNGTRGKSSVTRLIAAGLRAGGIRTCAKTTGTLPRFILPDASEEPVVRRNGANIIEQIDIVRRAVEQDAEAIVIECMAVNPLLQSLCELKLIRSTHGVITNARPDHLDKMGPTPADVARALAGTAPVGGTLFTAEETRIGILRDAADNRKSTLVPIGRDDVCSISPDELNQFSYVEHPENVALALQVCLELGVDRETALRGMQQAIPDPGAMTALELRLPGRRIRFVNGFAANDPESTEQNWKLASGQMEFADTRVAVVNCRADRPDRSLQLAGMCARRSDVDRCIVIGTGTSIFARHAAALGICWSRLHVLDSAGADEVVREILSIRGSACFVMGVGNIAGIGMALTHALEQHTTSGETVSEVRTLQEAA